MAYTPEQLTQMIHDRADHPDPTLAAVEAVLLRSAFERLDDFLLWLDEHTAREHPDLAEQTGRALNTVHRRVTYELAQVDAALVKIEE